MCIFLHYWYLHNNWCSTESLLIDVMFINFLAPLYFKVAVTFTFVNLTVLKG
jgi:hypothetical protein